VAELIPDAHFEVMEQEAHQPCAVAAHSSRRAATTSLSYLRAAEVADLLHVSSKTVFPARPTKASCRS
jgi:hypothetical protein